MDHGESKDIPEKTSTATSASLMTLSDCVDHNKLWKILRVWIPEYLTCLLRKLHSGQDAIVRTLHGTSDWVQNWERSMSRLHVVTLLI